MKKLRGSAILMVIAIAGITGFQVYWLKNNYDREKQNLDIKTASAFRQTILRLQSSKLKLDKFTVNVDSAKFTSVRTPVTVTKKTIRPERDVTIEPPISLIGIIQEKMRDSLLVSGRGDGTMVISMGNDTFRRIITDSFARGKGKIKSIMINGPFDSTMIDPSKIKRIISGDLPEPGEFISVDRSGRNRKPGKSFTQKDSFTYTGSGDVLLDRHIPLPPPGQFNAEIHENGNSSVFRFLYDVDSISVKDSVTIKEIDSAFTKRMRDEKIGIQFKVNRLDSSQTVPPDAVTIGFSKPTHFTLSLQNTMSYMFDKLKLPLLFSILLVGITVFSFVLLYRNMRKQQRLGELKNEFISNITHELKTPIATVGVAIEALKSFNAINDQRRTQEYLDISQNELQRLNLLVDKVLKLSMFEKKEIELKYENVDMKGITEEVISSLRLQIEKYRANVMVTYSGDSTMRGDRLHLLSVVFNLLDNALKYGGDKPEIGITVEGNPDAVVFKISDKGIGIPKEYQEKVFEKFFRIPHGDTHNAKGYGLGLSYTSHVVKRHKGTIDIQSDEGKGTLFTITLPKEI